jgi:hypothetical protein
MPYCVQVTSTTYQVTLCRPGSGPVSLNNITITPCCTPSVSCNSLSNVDIEGCAADIPAAVTSPSTVFTFEACGAAVTISHSDVGDTDFCTDGDGVDFTRTYTLFFDGVAQTPTCSQTIRVSDTTDPVFANCPASPIDLGCNPTPPVAANAISAAGAATDNCGGTPSISATGGAINSSGCNRTQLWTVTATDACGNEGVCLVTYTWQVVTAPVFNNCTSGDTDLGANPIDLPACDNSITAANECGPVTVTCTAGAIIVNGCNRSQTFTYVATGCGLSTTCTRTFTWQIPLSLSTTQINVLCNGASTGSIDLTVSGGVSPYTYDWSNDGAENPDNDPQDLTGLAAGSYTVTVTDANGCTQTTSATITQPTALSLTATTVNPPCCEVNNGSIDLTVSGGVSPYTYDWSNDGAENPDNDPQDLANVGVGTYTVTVTDANACTATLSRTLVSTDITPPQIIDIADVTLSGCNTTWPTLTTNWSDNCSAGGVITGVAGTILNNGCSQSRVYTFSVSDACGNTDVETTTVTRSFDATIPIFTVIPANVTVQCNNVPTPGTPTASDNCSTPTVVYNGETRTNGACPDSYTLTRRWTATDACGNTRTATQRITVVDTTKPSFNFVPQNLTLECTAPAVPVGTPTAQDNCDASVTITYLGEVCIIFECPANRQLRRTWRAVDNCGNSTTAMQTIDYRDTQAPTFTFVPPHITIECNNPLPSSPGTPTATDGCDPSVQITFNGQTSTPGSCPQQYVITRRWTAVDDCGNSVTATQSITVRDTQAPVFNNAPANITVMCGMVPQVPVVTATDNCDNNTPVIYLGEVNNGPNCPYTITRTWSVQDDCGNATMHAQVITVGPSGIGTPGAEERNLNTQPGNLTASLMPNPALDEVWVSFTSPAEADAILRLFDMNGRLIQLQKLTAAAGPNRYRIDLSGITRGGVYTVHLLVGDQIAMARLVIQKN